MRADAQAYAERNGSGGAGMRRSAANAPVHGWAVPAPTPNAPLRKEVERETDAPEGNLVIVERCARERQRLFSCREYGWDGTAHVLNSTPYGCGAKKKQNKKVRKESGQSKKESGQSRRKEVQRIGKREAHTALHKKA